MRCSEFAVRWNEVLDLRECPQDDAQLRAHLESCAACRNRQLGFELVCDILADWARPELSGRAIWRTDCQLADGELADGELADGELADGELAAGGDELTRRVLAELTAPRRGTQHLPAAGRFRALAVRAGAMGVAAAALLALYFSSGSQKSERRLPAPLALQSKAQPAETAVAHPAGDTLASQVRQVEDDPSEYSRSECSRSADRQTVAGQTVAGLSEESHSLELSAFGSDAVVARIAAVAGGIDAVVVGTGQELATVVQRIPDVAIELASDGRADLAAASEPLFTVSQSLRPVAASMTEAWQILKRAIPTGEPRRG